ncbi:MAG TPA: hypothetical protein VEC08_05980 [Nitrososphaerales archaeon]|nr:hypothetical protein [Nitrososphaerales archaeon]
MPSGLPYGFDVYYLVIAVFVVAVLRITWRTFSNYKGTVFSLTKTFVYAGIYVTLGVAFSALSFAEGVSYLMAIPEIAIVAAAAYASYRYTDGRISFWKSNEGSLFFKGGIGIYLVYLAGFLARLAIDVAFVGPSMFSVTSIVQLNGAALYASMASDVLLTLGVGLLIGRNVRVTKRYHLIQLGVELAPSLPSPRRFRLR